MSDARRKKGSADSMENWDDSYRGVVHLGSVGGLADEFTLCGLAFDEPLSEHGGEAMRPSGEPCTCRECATVARAMLPYLKKEVRRIGRTIDTLGDETI